MRHTDFINIRETHSKADVNIRFVLFYRIQFIADIARRLIDLHQYFIA